MSNEDLIELLVDFGDVFILFIFEILYKIENI
jgi:hypothetical protein